MGSVLAGLAATTIVSSWLDVVDRNRKEWRLSLTVLAIAATVAGGYALLGEKGAILAAFTMVLGEPALVGSGPERGHGQRAAPAARAG